MTSNIEKLLHWPSLLIKCPINYSHLSVGFFKSNKFVMMQFTSPFEYSGFSPFLKKPFLFYFLLFSFWSGHQPRQKIGHSTLHSASGCSIILAPHRSCKKKSWYKVRLRWKLGSLLVKCDLSMCSIDRFIEEKVTNNQYVLTEIIMNFRIYN